MEIVFATNNKGKLREIRELLGRNHRILSLNAIDFHEEIPETRETLEGNAAQKAFYIYDRYQRNCFADDTGLEVEALEGRPGVYSARYAGENCSPEDNIRKLLKELEGVENRKARFRTVMSLIINGEEKQFEGVVKGEILDEKKGKDGFGYDPVFLPEGYEQSFAEMPLSEKNKISHRGKAVRQLAEFLNNYR